MKAACLGSWLVASLLLLGFAQDAAGQNAPRGNFQLPSDPAAWVNTNGPISLQTLAGKGVVLYFYEEGCPRCRDRWPGILAIAKKYEGKPVFFMAVNSGNSRTEVEQYARDVSLTWPIIVDSTREFEKQSGIGEISLQNIYQAGIITSEGTFRRASASDLEGAAEAALAGAKWEVDPAGIPVTLQAAWTAIEFGNPSGAAAAVKKGLTSPKADVKAAATRLNDAVQAKIKSLVDAAKNAETTGNKWMAYKSYQAAIDQYGGYDLPPEVRANQKTLGEDEAVKKQVLAQKGLESAAKLLRSPAASVRRGAITKLKKLAEDYPDTDAAAEAQKLVAQLGG
jgi:thiol-disulfide isomerase/thioredoxin